MITQIDIISDPNCPFCALGVLQLQQALSDTDQNDAHLKWHPYSINPNLSAEGKDVRENLKAKYNMDDAEIEASFDRFKMQGDALGFDYQYPMGIRVYPSDRAQEFLAWVPEDKRTEAHFALMRKFFTESKSFYDLDELESTAKELGLDPQEARQAIEDGEFTKQVETEISYWQSQGIQGVPSFIFNDKYFLSGAIGIDGFKNIFQQINEQENAA